MYDKPNAALYSTKTVLYSTAQYSTAYPTTTHTKQRTASKRRTTLRAR